MSDQPWTLGQLQAAMRKAGWKKVKGSVSSVYEHPDGGKVYLEKWSKYIPEKILWKHYANRRQLPPTTEPPF